MTTTAAAMAFKAPDRQDSILDDSIQPGLPEYSEFASTTLTGIQAQQNSHNLPPEYEEDIEVPASLSPSAPRSSTASEAHRDSATSSSSSSIFDEKASLAAHYARQVVSATPSSLATPSSCADGFVPTSHLQVQHAGKSWLSLPLPPRPEPIPIFAVDASTSSILDAQPVYLSIRPSRRSGSSFLVRGGEWDEYSNTYDDGHEYKETSRDGLPMVPAGVEGGVKQLTTTTYKFGPGNPPVVSLSSITSISARETGNMERPTSVGSANTDISTTNLHEREKISKSFQPSSTSTSTRTTNQPEVSFEIKSKGLTTRAVEFETAAFLDAADSTDDIDIFTWRYASSSERRAMIPSGANSILVLERRRCRRTSSTSQKEEKKNRKNKEVLPQQQQQKQIARLIRNAEFRSPGSSASTAGNGGRLVLDLRYFESQVDKERAQQMVVTTVLIMLKREVDRRRAAQIAIMAGGAGGN